VYIPLHIQESTAIFLRHAERTKWLKLVLHRHTERLPVSVIPPIT